MLCSLLSSYFYAYTAAFVKPTSWGDRNFFIMLGFEFIFLCGMTFNFLKEFTKDGQVTPIRDLKLIAEKYIFHGNFFIDIIQLIPFPLLLSLKAGRESKLYIIKCTRVIDGFRLFDIKKVMAALRKFYRNRLEKIILRDPVRAIDKVSNQNKISEQIVINYCIKIIQLALIIFHLCFFLGIFWYIVTDVIAHDAEEAEALMTANELLMENTDEFIHFYKLEGNSPTENTIIGFYFAITTLSTVGFGDYTPRSD